MSHIIHMHRLCRFCVIMGTPVLQSSSYEDYVDHWCRGHVYVMYVRDQTYTIMS